MREADIASESAQASIGQRGRKELQPRTNRLSDARTARLLCLVEQLLRHFYRDFARGFHNQNLVYHT